MELFALLRTLGALGVVLGLLVGALWCVRRYDIALPGRIGGADQRRLLLVERLALDARHSLALIRRDGEEHLVLLSPERGLVIPSLPAPNAIPQPILKPNPKSAKKPTPRPTARARSIATTDA